MVMVSCLLRLWLTVPRVVGDRTTSGTLVLSLCNLLLMHFVEKFLWGLPGVGKAAVPGLVLLLLLVAMVLLLVAMVLLLVAVQINMFFICNSYCSLRPGNSGRECRVILQCGVLFHFHVWGRGRGGGLFTHCVIILVTFLAKLEGTFMSKFMLDTTLLFSKCTISILQMDHFPRSVSSGLTLTLWILHQLYPPARTDS